jgi:hypothetical protein
MRLLFCFGLMAASVPASASQPEMRTHGPWSVVSISSLAGGGENDASVILAQGEEPDVMQARWDEGGPVTVSMHVEKCSGEEDYDASYSVPVETWLHMSRRDVQKRLRTDMTAWLGQARRACPAVSVNFFKLARLDEAAADFHDRLRYYARGATGR